MLDDNVPVAFDTVKWLIDEESDSLDVLDAKASGIASLAAVALGLVVAALPRGVAHPLTDLPVSAVCTVVMFSLSIVFGVFAALVRKHSAFTTDSVMDERYVALHESVYTKTLLAYGIKIADAIADDQSRKGRVVKWSQVFLMLGSLFLLAFVLGFF